MAEMAKITSFFHPLISHSTLDSNFDASNKKGCSSRSHAMQSSPLVTNIFLISLISFFTIMSLFFLIITISISSKNRDPSLLSSLFGSDTTSTLPAHPVMVLKKMRKEEAEFWKQESDDDQGGLRKPCLRSDFSFNYIKASARVSKEKRRFLSVVVSGSGGLFQLRDQIIDAVLFSRVLGAALVIPVFKKESGFAVESEFGDIFDVEHFIRTIRSDVRVVASHPYTHLTATQVNGFELPRHVTPQWIQSKFRKQLDDNGVLVLNGIESKLVGKLPQDLLRLRCKVGFQALRFSKPIREIGYKLAKRLWIDGPYAAIDLGLNSVGQNLQFDAKHQHEHLKTGLVLGDIELQSVEMAKHLKGLGWVPRTATLYAATATEMQNLKGLKDEFPNLVNMETVARIGELSPFVNSSCAMAAIDYIVALNSDVFLVSGNTHLDRALQEHRAYSGHKKVIKLSWPEMRSTSTMDS